MYDDSTVSGRKVFKGTNPNNYITFAGGTWRIVAIEPDGKLKIMRTTTLSQPFDSNTSRSAGYCSGTKVGCNAWSSANPADPTGAQALQGSTPTASTLRTYLNGTFYNNNLSSYSDYIATGVEFGVGRTSSGGTLTSIYDGEMNVTDNSTVSIMRLSDYIKASSTAACQTGFSGSCVNNNWLIASATASSNYDGVYFINHTGTNNDYIGRIIIGSGAKGSIYTVNPKSSFKVFPMIYLKENIVLSGSGTSSDKYTISALNTCATAQPSCVLTISPSSGTVQVGGTKTFTISSTCSNISVTSNDANIATASRSGNTVTVTGVALGSTLISVTASETGYESTTRNYQVTVGNETCDWVQADLNTQATSCSATSPPSNPVAGNTYVSCVQNSNYKYVQAKCNGTTFMSDVVAPSIVSSWCAGAQSSNSTCSSSSGGTTTGTFTCTSGTVYYKRTYRYTCSS